MEPNKRKQKRKRKRRRESLPVEAVTEEGAKQEKTEKEKEAGIAHSRGADFTCYHCQEEGHIKQNCPKYKVKKGNDQSKQVAVVIQDFDGDLLLAVSNTTCTRKSDWVLDFGCLYHV